MAEFHLVPSEPTQDPTRPREPLVKAASVDAISRSCIPHDLFFPTRSTRKPIRPSQVELNDWIRFCTGNHMRQLQARPGVVPRSPALFHEVRISLLHLLPIMRGRSVLLWSVRARDYSPRARGRSEHKGPATVLAQNYPFHEEC